MGRASMTLIPKTNQVRIGLLESIKKYRNHNAGSEFLTPELQDYAFVRLEGSLSASSENGGFLRIGVNGNADDMNNKVLGIAQVNWLIHNAKIAFSALDQFELTAEFSFYDNMGIVEFTAQQTLNAAINPLKAYGVIENLPYPLKIQIKHTLDEDIILNDMNLYGVKAA